MKARKCGGRVNLQLASQGTDTPMNWLSVLSQDCSLIGGFQAAPT